MFRVKKNRCFKSSYLYRGRLHKGLHFCRTLNELKKRDRNLKNILARRGKEISCAVTQQWQKVSRCWQNVLRTNKKQMSCHFQRRGVSLLNVVTLCDAIIHPRTCRVRRDHTMAVREVRVMTKCQDMAWLTSQWHGLPQPRYGYGEWTEKWRGTKCLNWINCVCQ
jgi:hypothetical protein